MSATVPRRRTRDGFTLVELMVVIVILAILAAMLLAGVMVARLSARRAAIRTDISQIETALERYKQEYGEYPPDCAGLDSTDPGFRRDARRRVLAHIHKRFPRYVLPTDPNPDTQVDLQWPEFRTRVLSEFPNLDVDNLDPRSALVFWLGGLPDPTDPTLLTGFGADPANPFQSKTTAPSRIRGLADFRAAQLTPYNTSSSVMVYHPAGLKRPYAYFKSYPDPGNPTTIVYYYQGIVVESYLPLPYANSGPAGGFVNPNTYQIICAGLDDGYGDMNNSDPPLFPSGSNFNDGDFGSHLDNMTNFTSTTIEAEMSR